MKIYELTAFPKTEFGGNKAGVVLNTTGLSDEDMIKTAKKLGYSETAFVFDSEVADFKVRFFTPYHEVDLCGHATIATFNLLRNLKIIKPGKYTQETKAGVLKLDVQKDFVYMEQSKPQFYNEVPLKEIEQCFDIKHFVHEKYPIIIGSTGLKEIFVPIVDTMTLNALNPLKEEILELSIKYQVIGIHLFALCDECDAYCRNFAPIVGIDEESATGTSNRVLGAYFHKYITKKEQYTFRQGYSMNQPSEIKVIVKGDKEISVWVGGSAKQINKAE